MKGYVKQLYKHYLGRCKQSGGKEWISKYLGYGEDSQLYHAWNSFLEVIWEMICLGITMYDLVLKFWYNCL